MKKDERPWPIGRPEKWDRKQVAYDLIEWAKKPDSINLCKFCVSQDPLIAPAYLSIWANEDPDFSKAYETAKLYLGYRREEKLNNEELHVKAYDLNATTYDYFLKEERKDMSKFENDLKKEIADAVSEGDKQRHQELMAQLQLAQKQRAEKPSDKVTDKAE